MKTITITIRQDMFAENEIPLLDMHIYKQTLADMSKLFVGEVYDVVVQEADRQTYPDHSSILIEFGDKTDGTPSNIKWREQIIQNLTKLEELLWNLMVSNQ